MWFNLAASHLEQSSKLRETAIRNRNEVASIMTPAQIAEAQRLAREWKPKKERRRTASGANYSGGTSSD
jgi:hypothetical protein